MLSLPYRFVNNLLQAQRNFEAIAAVLPAASGTVTLSSGSVTVINTNVTANTVIRYARVGATASAEYFYTGVIVAGTSFTVKSSLGSGSASVYWEVVSW